MKPTLIIGSTVADIIISVGHIPKTGEDVNVEAQSAAPGGCAFNVSEILRLSGLPYFLLSPVGTGIYGDFVKRELSKRDIVPAIQVTDMDNGCCYCLVEPDGERTFLCDHGAEYFFKPDWLAALDANEFDGVFLCGIEIEETTGGVIIDWLETYPGLPVFFAPGPRIHLIDPEKIKRILAFSPLLHLNETEALTFTRTETVEEAAEQLYCMARNSVIITLSEKGAFCLDAQKPDGQRVFHSPGFPARIVNTIGAGDSHMGAVIAGLKQGKTLEEAVARANLIASKVVSVKEATLSPDVFNSL
ncbi:PfkB family carbohydrate kinase [Brucepastera parasyntrophica]|uniref:PfkB family carbohydrate kinase n=1 Tax=Brucepastera parasyntrophica TaxID=2880008 RepID=UPI00210DDD95|nr:PfkB family carbohydrate kinase [Brucepastera parasyntrophica]ULQ61087.1 PfkB family carbohydrate kinase [Brucepastera parasyntrophica]